MSLAGNGRAPVTVPPPPRAGANHQGERILTETFDGRRLAGDLLPAVLAAGRIEMRHYHAGAAVETKADASPVTAADREAEAVLLDALEVAAPGVPVIAEERASAGHLPETGDRFFLVDPLDGTREFIKKNGEFTINIGLIDHGAPVFGIVYAPALGRLYVSFGRGRPVRAQVLPDAPVQSLEDCEFSEIGSRQPVPTALIALESRSHRTAATDAFLARYPVAEVLASGSSLKFCLIAEGRADFYPRIGPTSEWDTAAGQAVLEAAGGTVATLDGRPLGYGKAADGYVNPHFVAWGRTPIAPRS